MGRKNRPFYRIVVADSRTPRDGRYIECIGTYDPLTIPLEVKLENERANYWMDQGAILTNTVKNLMQRQGILYRRYLKRKGFDEAHIEEEMKKWEVLQIERQRREAEKLKEKKKPKTGKGKSKEQKEVPPEADQGETVADISMDEKKVVQQAEPEASVSNEEEMTPLPVEKNDKSSDVPAADEDTVKAGDEEKNLDS